VLPDEIWAAKSEIDGFSEFTVKVLDHGEIALQATNGKYLSVIRWKEHDEIWAVRDYIDDFSHFTVEFLDDPVPTNVLYEGKIALRRPNQGKYLSVITWYGLDKIWAAKDNIDSFSRYTVTVLSEGVAAK